MSCSLLMLPVIIGLLFMFSGSYREVDMKYRTFLRLAFSKDMPGVILNNFSADRKAYTCTGIFCLTMQTLKNLKYLFAVFRVKSDSVICNSNVIILVRLICNKFCDCVSFLNNTPDNNFRLCIRFRKLDRLPQNKPKQ